LRFWPLHCFTEVELATFRGKSAHRRNPFTLFSAHSFRIFSFFVHVNHYPVAIPAALLRAAPPMNVQPSPSDVTQLLIEWSAGNRALLDELMPHVYDELRRLARRHLQRERPGHTLQTTALVHEAYLRLIDQNRVEWQNRAHFFAIAARVMRRILLMHARKKQAAKRGGGAPHLSLDEGAIVSGEQAEELIALDDALQRLEQMDERLGRVVECRYFGGLTIDETAEALDVSPATVKRDWRTAKAWLHRVLRADPEST